MTQSIPKDVLSGLSSHETTKASQWWADLATEARTEFLRLWDGRSEDTALHGVSRAGQIEWHELPIELHGRLADPEDLQDDRLAKSELLEYISGHEEVQFFLVGKSMHICRAHAEARSTINNGQIPRNFVCPLRNQQCPMKQITAAAGGKTVVLTPKLLGEA